MLKTYFIFDDWNFSLILLKRGNHNFRLFYFCWSFWRTICMITLKEHTCLWVEKNRVEFSGSFQLFFRHCVKWKFQPIVTNEEEVEKGEMKFFWGLKTKKRPENKWEELPTKLETLMTLGWKEKEWTKIIYAKIRISTKDWFVGLKTRDSSKMFICF